MVQPSTPMKHNEFVIRATFWSSGRLWRCTDIGTRVVIAIRIDHVEVEGSTPEMRRTLGYAEAEAEGWFNGPPYAVLESVFDEDFLDDCTLEPGTEAEQQTDDALCLDRTVFVVSPDTFDAFQTRINEPPQPSQKLRDLPQKRPAWEE
jgi:hypothetical protein